MPQGPVGGPRPGSDSTLLLRIKETPVVGAQPDGVFPEPLIRNGAQEEDIIEDIEKRTDLFRENNMTIDISNKFQRGLGQTDIYEIRVDISGMVPEDLISQINTLDQAGYLFELVEFE